jgi:hypothetical protein
MPEPQREYRQDDELGRGYCPHCHRAMSLDTSLYGWCAEHGRVPADFAKPHMMSDDARRHAEARLSEDEIAYLDEERKRDVDDVWVEP